MDLIINILCSAMIVMAIFLVIAVLMQSGKDSKLSGTIAGGGETFFGKTKGKTIDRVLAKATTVVSVIFVILVLVVYVLTGINSKQLSNNTGAGSTPPSTQSGAGSDVETPDDNADADNDAGADENNTGDNADAGENGDGEQSEPQSGEGSQGGENAN
jgi:preprotein translocase subunit SecG